MGTPARLVLFLSLAAVACARSATETGGRPLPGATEPPPTAIVPVRDPELELRAARLELSLMEMEAQIEELQARLDEARREVVRAMAKLQTLATRAEAASAMAEAEIALQARTADNGADAAEARRLQAESSAEFAKQNYGGALYLANQAKDLAGTGRARLGATAGSLRPGETAFAVPIPLAATATSNVREGPGMGYRVLFTAQKGLLLVGHSHAGEWVRVTDQAGRGGWVYLALVGRRDRGP